MPCRGWKLNFMRLSTGQVTTKDSLLTTVAPGSLECVSNSMVSIILNLLLGWKRLGGKGKKLNQDSYLKLAKPSEDEPVHYYSSTEKNLYYEILGMCAIRGERAAKVEMER